MMITQTIKNKIVGVTLDNSFKARRNGRMMKAAMIYAIGLGMCYYNITHGEYDAVR